MKKYRVEYREKACYSPVAKAGLILLLAVFGFLWCKLLQTGIPAAGAIVLGIGSIIMILFLKSFYNMEFKITEDFVIARFGDYNHLIPLEEIGSMKVVGVHMKDGLGLVMHKNRVAFVSNHKKGVQLNIKSGPYREVVLTAKNPEQFIKSVEKARAKVEKELKKKMKAIEKARKIELTG